MSTHGCIACQKCRQCSLCGHCRCQEEEAEMFRNHPMTRLEEGARESKAEIESLKTQLAQAQQQISELQEEYRRLQGVDNDNKALEYMVVKQADQIDQLQSTVRRYEEALEKIPRITTPTIAEWAAELREIVYEALTESSNTTGERG